MLWPEGGTRPHEQGRRRRQQQHHVERDDTPRTPASCHVREVGSGRVVYEPTSHEVVILNATAHLIFTLCDGKYTVRAMLDAMAGRFAASRDVLEKDLRVTLGSFAAKGLVE